MVTMIFREELLVTPLATARVVEELIPEETDIKVLKEIITLGSNSAAQWNKVYIFVEKPLEVIENGLFSHEKQDAPTH